MVHQHGHDIIVVTVCGRDLLSDDSCLEREGGGGGDKFGILREERGGKIQ